MNRHVVEELSAYMDGEARGAERIARHLQECPDCAQRYSELLHLSAEVKGLPLPEVRPEFVTRVMAHVAEAPGARRPWLSPLLGPAAVIAAAALLVLALATFLRIPPASSPVTVASKGPIAAGQPIAAEPARSGVLPGMDDSDDLNDNGDVSAEDLVAELFSTQDTAALVDEWEADEDIDSIIVAMDDTEKENLKELLREYALEGPKL